ncbi:MAG: DUF2007 domain-containing protein [Candidatus Zixiibacteriota bacterium]|nr:MAG: DUF2007 domain-containing protein [candidate division Zixibacteria bacterium]
MESDVVLILETKNYMYMNLVKEALENRDIPVLLKSPMGYYLRGMFPIDQGFFNLRLYVQKEFESEANEIVQTIVPPEEML